MEALDIVKYVRAGVVQSQIPTPIDSFSFEFAEEALSGRIIAAMTHFTHAANDLMIPQELLVFAAGELRTTIGVQDDRRSIGTLPAGHHDRFEHQLPVLDRRG